MKSIQITFLLFSFLLFGQHPDLKIEIINDTIKKVSFYDNCNILYSIKNSSLKTYILILDSDNFNEAEYEPVDSIFVGLPDYHVYKNEIEIMPHFSFGTHDYIDHFDFDKFSKTFGKFKRKNAHFFNYNNYDIRIAFRISKKLIVLQPGEEKTFTTRVNFPNYRMRYYDMINKEKYFFQISLFNPNHISKGITEKIIGKDKKYTIFNCRIRSNRVPLIYEVYNGAK